MSDKSPIIGSSDVLAPEWLSQAVTDTTEQVTGLVRPRASELFADALWRRIREHVVSDISSDPVDGLMDVDGLAGKIKSADASLRDQWGRARSRSASYYHDMAESLLVLVNTHIAAARSRDISSDPVYVRCGCTYDAELGEGSVCPKCRHRDHGRSGCDIFSVRERDISSVTGNEAQSFLDQGRYFSGGWTINEDAVDVRIAAIQREAVRPYRRAVHHLLNETALGGVGPSHHFQATCMKCAAIRALLEGKTDE